MLVKLSTRSSTCKKKDHVIQWEAPQSLKMNFESEQKVKLKCKKKKNYLFQ